MSFTLCVLLLQMTVPLLALKRDRFTLFDGHGDPHRIKEGKQLTISLLPDRCVGWEECVHTVSGRLLLVEDTAISIIYHGEELFCTHNDSTFNWNNWNVDEGTSKTIPNNRIILIETEQLRAGIVFAGISGAAFMTALFVAPLASIKWFNGWGFNANTYTSIAGKSLIVAGVSLPFAGVLGSQRRLFPKGYDVR